jgi:hypothetical protein
MDKLMNPTKTKENIRLKIREYLSLFTTGLFGVLLGLLLNQIGTSIPSKVLDALPVRPILSILGIAIVVILILALWIYALMKEKKMTLKDAVYWNKNNQPHCPGCKSPIVFTSASRSRNDTSYFCIKCDKWGYANNIHSEIVNG